MTSWIVISNVFPGPNNNGKHQKNPRKYLDSHENGQKTPHECANLKPLAIRIACKKLEGGLLWTHTCANLEPWTFASMEIGTFISSQDLFN